jgi:hypothetical protein
MARRYRDFPRIPGGRHLQELARQEIGGTPDTNPAGYALRSPINFARKIAFSTVPLKILWSLADEIVVDQPFQSGVLYRTIKTLNPGAPVTKIIGDWPHDQPVYPMMERVLRELGLLPDV